MKRKKDWRSARNIEWCEKYILIPEGTFVGQPLKVAEFMREDFRAIFDNPHGTRRAIVSRGRKNAKTVETAIIMLLYLCGPESAPNSQLYSAARSRDQAAVLFSLAAKMVRLSPDLSQALVIRDTAKEIFCPELGSKYKALSAEASTAFGLSPRFLAHDELGQVHGPRDHLYEALETATAAQTDPISVIISTQAPLDSDLLSILIDDAKTGADPRTVLRLNTADDLLDAFGEEAIRQANPAFDVFMNKIEVLDMAQQALRMPSRQSEYENLVLNRRVNMHNPFISRDVWERNSGEVSDDPFKTGPVYVGLDLSARNDLTAMVAVAKDAAGAWHVKCQFFTPLNGLKERAKRDRTPYDLWVQQGWMEATPGATVDYETVVTRLLTWCDSWPVALIAFDRWRIDEFKSCISRRNRELPMEPFGQGMASMAPALDITEAELLNERIRHGGHPVLRMCAVNAVVVKDPAGNRKLDKSKATGRIDGMVALVQALGVAVKVVPPLVITQGFVQI